MHLHILERIFTIEGWCERNRVNILRSRDNNSKPRTCIFVSHIISRGIYTLARLALLSEYSFTRSTNWRSDDYS